MKSNSHFCFLARPGPSGPSGPSKLSETCTKGRVFDPEIFKCVSRNKIRAQGKIAFILFKNFTNKLKNILCLSIFFKKKINFPSNSLMMNLLKLISDLSLDEKTNELLGKSRRYR